MSSGHYPMHVFLLEKIKDARWFTSGTCPRKIKVAEKAVLLQLALNRKEDLDVRLLMVKSELKDDAPSECCGARKTDARRLCEVLEGSRKMIIAELARVCGLTYRRTHDVVYGMVRDGVIVPDGDSGFRIMSGTFTDQDLSKDERVVADRERRKGKAEVSDGIENWFS